MKIYGASTVIVLKTPIFARPSGVCHALLTESNLSCFLVCQNRARHHQSQESHCTEQQAVDIEARRWAEQWRTGAPYGAPAFPEIAVAPPALAAQCLADAAASFPAGAGLGADNLAPRALARLLRRVGLREVRQRRAEP